MEFLMVLLRLVHSTLLGFGLEYRCEGNRFHRQLKGSRYEGLLTRRQRAKPALACQGHLCVPPFMTLDSAPAAQWFAFSNGLLHRLTYRGLGWENGRSTAIA